MASLTIPFAGKTPDIHPTAFVAPGVALIGEVTVGEGSSIWYGCVLRADENPIRIGRNTNLQDGTIVHIDSRHYPTIIGSDVTIGHMCLIHAATLEDGCFMGMRAVVMDGVVVERGAMVAAGALVTPGKRVKAGQLWGRKPGAPSARPLARGARADGRGGAELCAVRRRAQRGMRCGRKGITSDRQSLACRCDPCPPQRRRSLNRREPLIAIKQRLIPRFKGCHAIGAL